MRWQTREVGGGLTVRYRGGRYPVGAYVVPAEIEAVFDRADALPHLVMLRIEVTFDRRVAPELVEVAVRRRPGDPPIVTGDLRFPLADLVREAVLACANLLPTGRPASIADDAGLATALADHRRRRTIYEPVDGKGWVSRLVPFDEFLELLANAYAEGQLLGTPARTVADRLAAGDKPKAKRWLREARELGVLDRDPDEGEPWLVPTDDGFTVAVLDPADEVDPLKEDP